MQPKYFDVHAHLNFKDFDADRDEVIASCMQEGVLVNNVGTSLTTSREVVALAEAHEHLYATVGVHPTDWNKGFDEYEFRSLAEHTKVIAIGECGLDYYRIGDDSEKVEQKKLFEKHIALARAVGKPLMLHIRDSLSEPGRAYDDVLEILNAHPDVRAHAHFFAGDWSIAKRYIDRGITLSFTGVITFARQYDEVIRNVPMEMLMAETDAPYVAPEPYRGKRSEPLYVREVLGKLAEIRGESPEELAESILHSARRVLALPASPERGEPAGRPAYRQAGLQ